MGQNTEQERTKFVVFLAAGISFVVDTKNHTASGIAVDVDWDSFNNDSVSAIEYPMDPTKDEFAQVADVLNDPSVRVTIDWD